MTLFGDRLKKIRQSKGLTQEELGRSVNVTKVSISGYENGNRTPDMDTLQQLAQALNVSTDYLLGRSDKPSSDEIHSSVEREFLEWVRDNLTGAFFYDFDKSPEDSKKHMMDTLRLVWERERGRKPGQKQGE